MPVILCMVLGSVAHHLSPTHEALAVSAPFFYSAHVHRGRRLLLQMHKLVTGCRCLYSSVAERQSCKLKVLGSIPSGGCAASTLQVAMHGGTVNTCVLLAVLIAFLKPRWSCPPTSKCALLSLALGA